MHCILVQNKIWNPCIWSIFRKLMKLTLRKKLWMNFNFFAPKQTDFLFHFIFCKLFKVYSCATISTSLVHPLKLYYHNQSLNSLIPSYTSPGTVSKLALCDSVPSVQNQPSCPCGPLCHFPLLGSQMWSFASRRHWRHVSFLQLPFSRGCWSAGAISRRQLL